MILYNNTRNMIKKINLALLALVVPLLPTVAMAQVFGGDLSNQVTYIITFINKTLVPFLLTLAFLFFIYGVFKYFILGGDNDEKRNEGKQAVLWAVIAFVVVASIWGIVKLLTDGLGFQVNEFKYWQ